MKKVIKKKSRTSSTVSGIKAKRTKSKGTKTARTKKKQSASDRETIYPEPYAELYTGDSPITYEKAQELLGWEEEKDSSSKKWHKGVRECLKRKVYLSNNTINRFFYKGVAKSLKQEILRGRWRFNGEPIIVGVTGQILNGQHTLVSLIWAVEEWRESPDNWPYWKSEPTIEKGVTYGVSEDDDTANTMDTAKSRTDADVIGRMPYFKDILIERDRQACAMFTGKAVNILWSRVIEKTYPYDTKRTLSETLDIIDNHPKIVDCVKHIYTENGGGKFQRIISPGTASACLYLMATCDTDPQEYYQSDTPSEDYLDFSQWDKACDFFVDLAGKAKKIHPVLSAFQDLIQSHPDKDPGKITNAEKIAIIVKSWHSYADGIPIQKKDLVLEYQENDEGIRSLAEQPLFGGIDVGDELPFAVKGEKEQVEERKKAVRAKKEKATAPKQVAKRKGKEWKKGDTCWVHDPRGNTDTYFGKLSEDPYERYDGKLEVHIDADDGTWEALIENLSLKQFEMVQ